jgi:hypothetical protein
MCWASNASLPPGSRPGCPSLNINTMIARYHNSTKRFNTIKASATTQIKLTVTKHSCQQVQYSRAPFALSCLRNTNESPTKYHISTWLTRTPPLEMTWLVSYNFIISRPATQTRAKPINTSQLDPLDNLRVQKKITTIPKGVLRKPHW